MPWPLPSAKNYGHGATMRGFRTEGHASASGTPGDARQEESSRSPRPRLRCEPVGRRESGHHRSSSAQVQRVDGPGGTPPRATK